MRLYRGNTEPPIDELLDDPIASLLFARDRLDPGDVRRFIEEMRRWWSAEEAARPPLPLRERWLLYA